MPTPRRRDFLVWVQAALVLVGVSASGLILAHRMLRRNAASPPPLPLPPAPAAAPSGPLADAAAEPRQVTVLAIRATPGESRVDPRLSSVKPQLRKILPDHGFRLIEVRSGRLEPGQSLTCDLGEGWRSVTALLAPSPDDFGRVRLRCELTEGGATQFSTVVDAPENQLFFYERALPAGDRALIGVGAR